LAESAQLALEDEEIEDNFSIFTATVISYDHEVGIDNPMSHKAATKSPLAETCNSPMIDRLDEIGQDPVIRDCLELPEGRKALRNHWVYMIKCDGAGNVQWIMTRLLSRRNYQIVFINH